MREKLLESEMLDSSLENYSYHTCKCREGERVEYKRMFIINITGVVEFAISDISVVVGDNSGKFKCTRKKADSVDKEMAAMLSH